MKANGAVHLDYSIVCYECGKLLRTVGGKDLEEIHTDSEGEDVCADCCDVCKYVEAHNVWWEDAIAILRGEVVG